MLCRLRFLDEIWNEKAPKMHPLNLQNHGFHSEGIQNPGFSRFLENAPKRTSRDPPGEAKWRPKSLRGGLKTMKNGPRIFLGPPPARTSEFFSPPEASRSTPGTIFKASWQPPGAHWVPRWSPEASRRPPEGHLGHFRNNFGFIFASFLVTFAAVLAPVLGPPRSSFSFAPCHVLIPFRWRARVRSLFLEGFEALSWKVGRPRFLKPWVAAGGREAIGI